jgi:class 3 adenylate cyclase/tetratricopeptide (TPR) repeat protein
VEVAGWLRGLGLDRYIAAFQENHVTPDLLTRLSPEDLKDIGVASVGHRRLILSAVEELKKQQASGSFGEGYASHHPVSSWPAPEVVSRGERRQLSVVFCDLVGSTALSVVLDPEDLREVIGAYHSRVASAVSRFNGFVAEYLGDGVIVYFGWPQASEWDAEQAINAAIEIVDEVGLVDAGGQRCHVRIGIATGLVVVGGHLSGNGNARPAVGQTPNLAARLQGLAEPDTIVIDQATYARAGNLYVCEALPPTELRGFAEPVSAWRVRGRAEVQSRFEARHRELAGSLIGREAELRLLLDRWAKAREGRGQIVLLSGEPGIGKSRLIAGLEATLAASPYATLRYFCSPHRQNSALYPVITHLERSARFERGDSMSDRMDKLRSFLAATGSSEEELAVFADLLAIPAEGSRALQADPRQKKEMTFAALIRLLECTARTRPALIVLEDAHWSDPTTCEFLDLAVDRLRQLPILLVVTFRPEFHPSWAGEAITQVSLPRLDEASAGRLVAEIAAAGLLREDLASRIVHQAEGVPLFIEELTKTILASRHESLGEGRVALPDTLQASLVARLDRFPAAKQVAQIGAVIGREFSEELIASIAPFSPETLREGLDQLVASGLASRRGEGTSSSWVFKHALVQDAAYENLLRSERSTIHGLIAGKLSQSPEITEGSPEILARHYAGAGITDRAVLCWLRAAELAMNRWANLEAIGHLRAALAAIDGDSRHNVPKNVLLDIWMRLADSLLEARGHASPETASAYARTVEIARDIGAQSNLFAALVGLGHSHLHKGELDEGLKISQELVERAAAVHDLAAEAAGHRMLGATLLQKGDLPTARKRFEIALKTHDGAIAGQPFLASHRFNQPVSCRYYLSQTLLPMGMEAQARAFSREALDLAKTSPLPSHLTLALEGLCSLHQHCREWDELACQSESLVRLASDKRLPFWLSFGEVSQGLALAYQGSPDMGIRQIEAGVERYRNSGAGRSRPALLGALAAAHAWVGDLEQAALALDEAIGLAQRMGHRAEGELRRQRGELFLLQVPPHHELAEADFRKACAIACAQSARTFELRAMLCLLALPSHTERTGRREAINSMIPSLPPGLLQLEVDRMTKNSPLLRRSGSDLSDLTSQFDFISLK